MKTYLVKNQKKTVIAQHTVFHVSMISKGLGLMLRKNISGKAHFFPFRKPKKIAVTMMFMRFPLDIIFLREGKVVELKEDLKPWKDYYPRNLADTLLEIRQGTIRTHGISIGDEIGFAKE